MCLLLPCVAQFSRFDVENKTSLKTRGGNHLLSDCAWEGVTGELNLLGVRDAS